MKALKHKKRLWLVATILYLGYAVILGRLFYWQVLKSDNLQAIAQSQYQKRLSITGQRGSIFTADDKLLVGNQTVYRLFAEPEIISDPQSVQDILAPLLAEYYHQEAATSSSDLDEIRETVSASLAAKLVATQSSWISLAGKIDEATKRKIEQQQLNGIGFDPYLVRTYPEASMAAQLLGFVGKDAAGYDTGYFGLEGGLDKELQKRSFKTSVDIGLLGFNLFQAQSSPQNSNGRDIILSVRRDIQFLLEEQLDKALRQYGAVSGEIIVMDPKTGKILGAAAAPNYDPATFYKYEQHLYKNPHVTDVFEPGSTFKVLTVAAGIDTDTIQPETKCPRCDKPVTVDKYTIKTWNNEYNPDISMTDALAKSDNTAMVFIAQELGIDTFKEYVERFAISQPTTDELQEDRQTPFPDKWGPVELATRSFGQGISTTSLQLLRAVGAIANQGVMMQPSFLEAIVDPITGEEIPVYPKQMAKVVSAETAQTVTEMLVTAANSGEAQWTASDTHSVAAKTGTAQIAVDGKYDADKTMASFIGYSPAHNPRYLMLVKLREPESSPWASETAAPLWYKVADRLNLLLNVPPDLE